MKPNIFVRKETPHNWPWVVMLDVPHTSHFFRASGMGTTRALAVKAAVAIEAFASLLFRRLLGKEVNPVSGSAREWTLVKSQREFSRWERSQQIYYQATPAGFPCFVREDIATDENSRTQLLYPADMLAMVASAYGIPEAQPSAPPEDVVQAGVNTTAQIS